MAAPPIAVPRYFTVVEVARALGVAQQRLRALVAAGNGPPGAGCCSAMTLWRRGWRSGVCAWSLDWGAVLAREVGVKRAGR